MQVIGNLGKDCVTNLVNGKNVINFNVAHTEKFRDAKGEQKEKTVWVDCAYWTDRTAIAPYLKKRYTGICRRHTRSAHLSKIRWNTGRVPYPSGTINTITW